MNKVIKIATALTILATFQAEAGFYLGGNVGLKALYASNKNTLSAEIAEVPGVVVIDSIRITDDANLGWGGGTATIYLGYGIDLPKKFHLGVEGNAEFNSIGVDNNFTINLQPFIIGIPIDEHISVKNSFGLSFLPGYYFSKDILLFLRAGVSYGNVESTIHSSLGDSSISDYKLGEQYGVGLEYFPIPALSIRSEVNYSIFQSIDQNIDTVLSIASPATEIPIPIHTSNSIRSMGFSLGLTYWFDRPDETKYKGTTPASVVKKSRSMKK